MLTEKQLNSTYEIVREALDLLALSRDAKSPSSKQYVDWKLYLLKDTMSLDALREFEELVKHLEVDTIVPCYVIVVLPSETEDDEEMPTLSTRKQFETKVAAENHIKFYAESVRNRCMVVECPKGLVY